MAKTKGGPERKSALRKPEKVKKEKAAKAEAKNASMKAKKKTSLIAAPAKVAKKIPQGSGSVTKDKVKELAAQVASKGKVGGASQKLEKKDARRVSESKKNEKERSTKGHKKESKKDSKERSERKRQIRKL